MPTELLTALVPLLFLALLSVRLGAPWLSRRTGDRRWVAAMVLPTIVLHVFMLPGTVALLLEAPLVGGAVLVVVALHTAIWAHAGLQMWWLGRVPLDDEGYQARLGRIFEQTILASVGLLMLAVLCFTVGIVVVGITERA